MIRILVGVAALSLMTVQANAYWNLWRGKLPDCTDLVVLEKVKEKIAYGSPRVLGYDLAIEDFDAIAQDDVNAYEESWIDRRYCSATAWLSNGESSEVVYLIEAGQGFAGNNYKVQSCLPGYDRWRVYDGWCRSIRP